MALQDLDLFWKKWFEYYNIEFGTYDGTFVLYFENNTIETSCLKFRIVFACCKG